MINKPLPHNSMVEKELLSMIIQKNDIFAELIGMLVPEDFYVGIHSMIYKKMLSLYSRDVPIDVQTIVNNIDRDTLQSIGGVTFLADLSVAAISTANYKHYAKMIKNSSHKRKIIKGCMEAMATAFDDTDVEPLKIVDDLENKFITMNSHEQEGTVNAFELMESTIDLIEDGYKNGGKTTGITTGYKSLDKAINGLIKKDFLLIAARPSMGKTALIMNIANNIPKTSNIMIFELEMSKEKLGIRLLAPKTLKNPMDLAKGNIKDNDFELLTKRASEISDKNNIYLNCKGGLSLAELRSESKKIKIKHGLDIIIIDHIGKIKPDNLKASRNDQVGQISEGLKNLAKELDACVIALSQLNRECEKRADKHPQLSDLRDSGNLEQDADAIMFLYRDDYYAVRENRESDSPGVMDILIAKNRDGEVSRVELSYNTDYQRITEVPFQPKNK